VALSENEIIDRHMQALGEAKRECLWLGAQQDEDMAAPRGRHYEALKVALKAAEGSARQMSYHRSDTRWIKLGILYAKVLRKAQQWYVSQAWRYFSEVTPMFDGAMRDMQALAERKTGMSSSNIILPSAGNMDWVKVPDWKNPWVGDHLKVN
jgi:hypothetical protein